MTLDDRHARTKKQILPVTRRLTHDEIHTTHPTFQENSTCDQAMEKKVPYPAENSPGTRTHHEGYILLGGELKRQPSVPRVAGPHCSLLSVPLQAVQVAFAFGENVAAVVVPQNVPRLFSFVFLRNKGGYYQPSTREYNRITYLCRVH